MKQTDTYHGPTHGPVKAALMALLRPVTAVRRGDHQRLITAWGVHLLGGLGVVFAVWVLSAWSMMSHRVYGREAVWLLPGEMGELAREFFEELDQVWLWVAMVFTAVGIELTWLVSAGAAMSWSAMDEPIRTSYAKALRRLWLVTPHGATLTLVVGAAIVWADRSRSGFFMNLRNAEQIVVAGALILGGLWLIRVFLGALTCKEPSAVCLWPARCLRCGYQLTGLDDNQSCPECGSSVQQSLDPKARQGITMLPGPGGWLAQTRDAVRRPKALGQTVHVLTPDAGHRKALYWTILLIMLSGPIAMLLGGAVVMFINAYVNGYSFDNWMSENIWMLVMVGFWLALWTAGVAVGLVLLVSTVVGLIEGVKQGRNLMPASVRAAGYQSGFLLLWTWVFAVNVLALVIMGELDLLQTLSIYYNLDMELFIFLWFTGVCVLGLAIYVTLITRATRAARHASW